MQGDSRLNDAGPMDPRGRIIPARGGTMVTGGGHDGSGQGAGGRIGSAAGVPRRRGEAGEGRIGCIFWSVLLIVGFVVAWQMVPVKVRTSELHDYMIDQANFAGSTSEDGIKKRILSKANDLDLPVGPKNLTVTKERERIKMHTEYTVVVEFPFGFSYDWEFEHDVDRPIFYY